LPPPEILKQYNDAFPDGANRVVEMAEKQAAHRQSLESKVIDADIARSKQGLWAGLVVALAMIAAGVYSIQLGHEVVGGTIMGIDLIGLVGVFVYGNERRIQERTTKAAIMTGQAEPSPKADQKRDRKKIT
jgi:uncharacterized membrane protein